MEYLPFGETLVEEHLNSNNSPFKFNAKEHDAETGWYYYGARYYDPKWSVWLSVDPLAKEFPDWSPYNYTMNNPINMTDPDGRSPNPIIGGLVKQAFQNAYIAKTRTILNSMYQTIGGSSNAIAPIPIARAQPSQQMRTSPRSILHSSTLGWSGNISLGKNSYNVNAVFTRGNFSNNEFRYYDLDFKGDPINRYTMYGAGLDGGYVVELDSQRLKIYMENASEHRSAEAFIGQASNSLITDLKNDFPMLNTLEELYCERQDIENLRLGPPMNPEQRKDYDRRVQDFTLKRNNFIHDAINSKLWKRLETHLKKL